VSVFFIPQRSILCERLLKAEGVYGDLAIADIPVDWVPYDTDVLSLELESTFRVRIPNHFVQNSRIYCLLNPRHRRAVAGAGVHLQAEDVIWRC